MPNYTIFGLLLVFAYTVFGTEDKTSAPVASKSEEHQAKFANLCEEFPQLRDCLDMDREQMMEKRKSAYMRFGRSAPELDSYAEDDDSGVMNMEKRKSAYMRFGKRFYPVGALGFNDDVSGSQEVAKRKSAYMRFGKRKSAYMRFGKRSSFEDDDFGNMEKRKSAYMRFGRR